MRLISVADLISSEFFISWMKSVETQLRGAKPDSAWNHWDIWFQQTSQLSNVQVKIDLVQFVHLQVHSTARNF